MRKTNNIGIERLLLLSALFLSLMSFGCNTGNVIKPSPYQPDLTRQVWIWGPGGSVSSAEFTAPPGTSRFLKKGDRLNVSLTGIPLPDEIANVVNDLGEITLPLVGAIKVDGLTTAEAEKTIKKKYIDEDLYRSIDVIIMVQEGAFFVTGEVRAPGRYPVSGETTLLRAIAVAGGFTDFAERRKIELTRAHARQKEIHNADKIRARETEDPPVRADDMITVYINRLGL